MPSPVADHAGRRQLLRETLAESGVDGLLVSNLTNIAYLTGFTGSNAGLYVSALSGDLDVFCTDGRYSEQAQEQCPDLGVLIQRDSLAGAAAQSQVTGAQTLGVESTLTVQHWEQLRELSCTLSVIDGAVERYRLIKDADEFGALARANAITAQAMNEIASGIRIGDSEISIARRLELRFSDLGADDRAFPTIVAAGANSAKPHHEPGLTRIADGDLIIIDCGALVDGYHADCTRTFIAGRPDPWQLEIHHVVRSAQAAARTKAAAGVHLRDIDAAARHVIDHAGFGPYFDHGLGHGTGLDIHEAPMISARAIGRLPANTTITVEPGIYLPGRGGVRIEDSVAIHADQNIVLTQSPYELVCVG